MSSRRMAQRRTPSSAAAANDLRLIPQFRSNIEVRHTYRFVFLSGQAATPITSTTIAGAVGTIATSTTAVKAWAASVRVNQIKLWACTTGAGSASTVAVEWESSLTSSNTREVSDTSISTAVPACVRTGPPQNSLARFWQAVDNGATLAYLTGPTGTIADVDVSFILDDEDTFDTGIAVSSATLGHTYYLYLDGSTLHQMQPVSLNATF
jgi:hypothetical protein